MKTLIFEGAGWVAADSSKASDVGNCRIRSTFKNKHGREIYLELNGHPPHKHSPQYMKNFTVGGWVSHSHDVVDGEKLSLRNLDHNFEYCKASILKLVNGLEIGGDFECIEVRDSWCGFSVDGKGKL